MLLHRDDWGEETHRGLDAEIVGEPCLAVRVVDPHRPLSRKISVYWKWLRTPDCRDRGRSAQAEMLPG